MAVVESFERGPHLSARHTGWFLPDRTTVLPTEYVLRALLLVQSGQRFGVTADIEYFPTVADTELEVFRDVVASLDNTAAPLVEIIEHFPIDRVVAIHLYTRPDPPG